MYDACIDLELLTIKQTGIYPFNPDVAPGTSIQPVNASWAVTVTEDFANGNVQLAGWYNTNGLNYSDSLTLGYDVCSVALTGYTENTLRRGQFDNGDCVALFDEACVEALEQQSQNLALYLVGNPKPLPNSNLTADSLPTVCDSIGQSMEARLPDQCKPYMNESWYTATGYALTMNYESSGTHASRQPLPLGLFFGNPRGPCTATGPSANETWNLIGAAYGNATVYDYLTYTVLPILTVFMPVANARRTITIISAHTTVSCLRTNEYSPGSRVPPPLPAPTPVGEKGGLSGKAIAGIVVGVLAGVSIICFALVAWWWRKRKVKISHEAAVAPRAHENPAPDPRYGGVVNELDSSNVYSPELPDMASRMGTELGNSQKPAELQADVPRT